MYSPQEISVEIASTVAEQAVLGAVFLDNRALEAVSFLRPEHFYHLLYAETFQIFLSYRQQGRLIDPITIAKHFSYPLKDHEGNPITINAYMASLIGVAVTSSTAGEYGRIVLEYAQRRSLIEYASIIRERALKEHSRPIKEHIAMAEKTIFELSQEATPQASVIPFSSSVASFLEDIEQAYRQGGILGGISTGYKGIDEKLGGLHPSDLIILAGRPSMGKTALATNIAVKIAQNGVPVAFFSLEMSHKQLTSRIMADWVSIRSDKLKQGKISAEELQTVQQASQELASLPLFIEETGGLPISDLMAQARRLKRKHKIGLVVVDYLQLIRASHTSGRDNRVQELSEITQSLKALAKELDLPVLALSQLSRAVETREEKRPQLSDLRDSGSIEQDADVVMFVYREEYYLSRKEPSASKMKEYTAWKTQMHEARNTAEIIIQKHRQGATGTVKMGFEAEFTRFKDGE